MKIIYIAGPYTGEFHDHRSYFEISDNIRNAMKAAAAFANDGIGFFCPHSHCAHFEVITPDVKPAFWYDLDNHFLRHSDAVFMLEGWERSKGSIAERDLAFSLGLPIFYESEDELADAAKYMKTYMKGLK